MTSHLTLNVISFKGERLYEIAPVTVGQECCRIGRAIGINDLVLPDADKLVSRNHAHIDFENDCYYLTDTSKSGVYLNHQHPPMLNETVVLENGSVLKIGEYEVSVVIVDDGSFLNYDHHIQPVLIPEDLDLWGCQAPRRTDNNSLMSGESPPTQVLIKPSHPVEPGGFVSGLGQNQSPVSSHYKAPGAVLTNKNTKTEKTKIRPVPVRSTEGAQTQISTTQISTPSTKKNENEPLQKHEPPTIINTNNPEGGGIKPQKTCPAPVPPKGGPPIHVERLVDTENALIKAFFRGAGISVNQSDPMLLLQACEQYGNILRLLLEGAMMLLATRAQCKNEFRIANTVFDAVNPEQAENNPIKFMQPDQFLQHVLNPVAGYSDPVKGVKEALEDECYHQLAMMAGTQASISDVLKTFAPKIIERQFELGIVLQKKAKCWDRFIETYQGNVEEAEEHFYGEAFVKAYEQERRRLRQQQKKTTG